MKKLLKYIYEAIPFKRQLFSALKQFNLPETVFKHLFFEDVFKVKFETYAFNIRHYGFQIENEIFWKGLTNSWEKISMQLWIELSKNSAVILDVGANTGVYSLVSKAVNADADVYAFEPVKRIYQKLQANNKLNDFNIKSFETALSDKDGEAIIYDPLTPHIYSVAVNKNIAEVPGAKPVAIKTQKLSTFIKAEGLIKIDLIKIDVETHEPEVLAGMDEYLHLFKPTLLIEILNDEIGSRVESLIKNINYLYYTIDEMNAPKLVKKIEKSKYFNYLICSPEIAKSLNLTIE